MQLFVISLKHLLLSWKNVILTIKVVAGVKTAGTGWCFPRGSILSSGNKETRCMLSYCRSLSAHQPWVAVFGSCSYKASFLNPYFFMGHSHPSDWTYSWACAVMSITESGLFLTERRLRTIMSMSIVLNVFTNWWTSAHPFLTCCQLTYLAKMYWAPSFFPLMRHFAAISF